MPVVNILAMVYTDNLPDKPLTWMPDPIPDEEIEALTGTKRMKIMSVEDTNVSTTTVEDVEMIKQTTGANKEFDECMIVYADQTPGSSGTNPKNGEIMF